MSRADIGTERTDRTTDETIRIVSITSVAVAVLGLLSGVALGRLLAGTFVFLVGMWTAIGLGLYEWRSTQGSDTNESHEVAFERASYWTVITVIMTASLLFPPVFLLVAGGWIGNVPGYRYVVGTFSIFLLFFTALYVMFRVEI